MESRAPEDTGGTRPSGRRQLVLEILSKNPLGKPSLGKMVSGLVHGAVASNLAIRSHLFLTFGQHVFFDFKAFLRLRNSDG